MSKKKRRQTRPPKTNISQNDFYNVMIDYLPEEEINKVYRKLTNQSNSGSKGNITTNAEKILESFFKKVDIFYEKNKEGSDIMFHLDLGDEVTELTIIIDSEEKLLSFYWPLFEYPKNYKLAVLDILNSINPIVEYGYFVSADDLSLSPDKFTILFYLNIPLKDLNTQIFSTYFYTVIESIEIFFDLLKNASEGHLSKEHQELLKEDLKILMKVIKKLT